jgi:hypothetical protein
MDWTYRMDRTHWLDRSYGRDRSDWLDRSYGMDRSYRMDWTHWLDRSYGRDRSDWVDRSYGRDRSDWVDRVDWIYWIYWSKWIHGCDGIHRTNWMDWNDRSKQYCNRSYGVDGSDGLHRRYWNHRTDWTCTTDWNPELRTDGRITNYWNCSGINLIRVGCRIDYHDGEARSDYRLRRRKQHVGRRCMGSASNLPRWVGNGGQRLYSRNSLGQYIATRSKCNKRKQPIFVVRYRYDRNRGGTYLYLGLGATCWINVRLRRERRSCDLCCRTCQCRRRNGSHGTIGKPPGKHLPFHRNPCERHGDKCKQSEHSLYRIL